jgi:hypothetical protein
MWRAGAEKLDSFANRLIAMIAFHDYPTTKQRACWAAGGVR